MIAPVCGFSDECGERKHKQDPKTLRVAIYCRKSNDEGRSRSRFEQLEQCKAEAKYMGYLPENTIEFIEDDGQKGTWWWQREDQPGPYRPELTKLVRMIKADQVDVVMVWRSDRLYRDYSIAIELAKIFEQHGVVFVAGGREIDYTSAEGEFSYVTDAASNKRMRDRIAEDIKRAHASMIRRGLLISNPSCLGIRSAGRQKVAFIEDEVRLVQRIFDMFVHGEDGSAPLGVWQIALKLQKEGIRLVNGSRNHRVVHPDVIEAGRIGEILQCVMYVGKYRSKKTIYDCPVLLKPSEDGDPEPIVSQDIFDAAQMRLSNSRGSVQRARNSPHLGTPIVVCGSCGAPMWVRISRKTGAPVGTYGCSHRKGIGACCAEHGVYLREVAVNDYICNYLAPFVNSQIAKMKAEGNEKLERERILALEAKLEEAVLREGEQLASLVGRLDADQIETIGRRLSAERRRLQLELLEARERIAAQDIGGIDQQIDLQDTKSVVNANEALRRCVQWIALTHSGVVTLTQWGSLIASYYTPGSTRKGDIRRIQAPSVEAAMECLDWFDHRQEFIAFRRRYTEKTGGKSDEEILPSPCSTNDAHMESEDETN